MEAQAMGGHAPYQRKSQGAEMTPTFHTTLTAERRAVAVELQGRLVDLLDLTLVGKHCQWNVDGRRFRAVHRELAEFVDDWHRLADDIAERAVAIGASPYGQVEAIAGATNLASLPSGRLSDRLALRAIGDRLAAGVIRTRESIERVAVDDPVTCDLLVRVAARLEKQLWQVRAQMSDPIRGARRRTEDASRGGGS
jgi:starvation-inducible DNA-binding protein